MTRQCRNIRKALAAQLDQSPSASSCAEQPPELEGLLRVAAGLTELWQRPVPTPPTGLMPGRSRFLTRAASHPSAWSRQHRRSGAGIKPLARAAIAIAFILAALTPFGRGIVRAARDSAPGHLLYPLKVHIEHIQYAGAEQPDVRVALSLAFLGERIAESQALVHGRQELEGDLPIEVQLLTNQLLQAIAETPTETLPDVLSYAQQQLHAYLKVLITLEPLAGEGSAQNLAGMTQACRRAYLITTRALVYPTEFQTAYGAGRPELFLLPGERPLNGE